MDDLIWIYPLTDCVMITQFEGGHYFVLNDLTDLTAWVEKTGEDCELLYDGAKYGGGCYGAAMAACKAHYELENKQAGRIDTDAVDFIRLLQAVSESFCIENPLTEDGDANDKRCERHLSLLSSVMAEEKLKWENKAVQDYIEIQQYA